MAIDISDFAEGVLAPQKMDAPDTPIATRDLRWVRRQILIWTGRRLAHEATTAQHYKVDFEAGIAPQETAGGWDLYLRGYPDPEEPS